MPWRSAVLRGSKVLARCDERGDLVVDGGRVEVRYKPKDGKAYRAAPGNLQLEDAQFPDDYCAEAGEVPAARSAVTAARSAAPKKTGFSPVTTADVIAYTDGACSGNPGPAGLGVVLLVRGVRHELSEYLGTATNNIAELTAILRVLERLDPAEEGAVVHTDSQYAIGVLEKGWKAKANVELIATTKARLKAFKGLKFVYVRGHAGIPLNERADELARQAVSSRDNAGWQQVGRSIPVGDVAGQ